ncbi:4-hydroxy-tetrahydrodipicolinate synthase [Kribbella sp. VKM Ac-2571]|uniref:dihydrodipicolinate synthase family protein n=1 Tax=Kribbella sp. VKM Ac-2571 TaxID=2512222 RepID=UPI00105E22FF|nr:dihydrodipicolinate synthase family protein [Kribbella sp. VKM Ac-2571]TDO68213.1 4-hydroxy-tetrahydrodipicolinate synthase [Kribbella sp. VKM Ac-2571]
MTASAHLTGVVPPLVTPLTPSYDVDTASLARLIQYQLTGGVDGVFVLGTSGEGTFLTDEQRQVVLETTVAEVAGQVPVLAGVIDTSTNRVTAHVSAALKAGVDGIVATAPFYAATHPAEIERHFVRLASLASDTPLYAYDIPPRAGTKLPAALVMSLGEQGVIAGVKDSSGQETSLRELVLSRREKVLDDFVIMTGSEVTVDSALAFGVDGVVPGLGNVDPAGYVRLFKAAVGGDAAAARDEQDRLFRLFDIINVADRSRMGASSAALGAFKAGLYLLGVIDCPVTAYPSIPLNDTEIAAVRPLLERAGLH